LPICLASDVKVKRNIMRDEKILLDDVAFDPLRDDFVLYDQACQSSATIRLSLNDSDG